MRVEKNQQQQQKNQLKEASGDRVPGTLDLVSATGGDCGERGRLVNLAFRPDSIRFRAWVRPFAKLFARKDKLLPFPADRE